MNSFDDTARDVQSPHRDVPPGALEQGSAPGGSPAPAGAPAAARLATIAETIETCFRLARGEV